LPGSKCFPALERGTLDVAEFVGPSDGEKLGLSKVAKFYYAPGWREGGAMLHLVVNIDKWNELPKCYLAILFQAAEAANQEGVRFACGVPRRVAALVGGQPAAKRAGAGQAWASRAKE